MEKLSDSDLKKSADARLEVIGKQNTLFGSAINLTQFKNLKEKRELKEKVLKLYETLFKK